MTMFYTTSELLKKYKNQRNIKKAQKNNKLYKVAHGIYSNESMPISDLEKIFIRYPRAILTNESAFAFYELSDYIPEKYTIVTPLNSHKINELNIDQFYMQNSIQQIGRVKVKTQFGYIYIYDRERMLIELFRLKSKFSYEYFKEIINNYRSLNKESKLDTNKIVKYCNHITYGRSIRKRIEMTVL